MRPLFPPSADKTRAGDPGFPPSAHETRAGDPGFPPSAHKTRAGDPGLARSQAIAVAVWLALGAALWNGIFEMMVVRGAKEYLFRAALFDAGRGPLTPIRQVMDPAIYHATWVATLWTSVVVFAAMMTIRWLTPTRDA